MEEDFLAMKARISRLVEGDRNTTFFHAFAVVRRRHIRFFGMKDRMDNWLEGDKEITDYIRNGFLEPFPPINVVPLYSIGTLHFGKFLCMQTMLKGWPPSSRILKSGLLSGPLSYIELRGLMASMQGFPSAFGTLWVIL